MRLLLTNDDGIDAPGLAALYAAAERLGDCCILAPADAWSGCGHQVTTSKPIRVQDEGENRLRVFGSPADCVRLGLHHLHTETTWVLSGINCGGNLGADIYHSGTVAAVREAVLHGRPGIAVSHYRRRNRDIDWARAVCWLAPILADLTARPWTPGTFWNINLPHLEPEAADPAVVFCPIDPAPLPLSFRAEADGWVYSGDYHQRHRQAGSDVDVCFRGRIAVSQVVLLPGERQA